MVKSCVEPILDGWSLRLLSIGGTFWQWLASYESDSDGNPPENWLTNWFDWCSDEGISTVARCCKSDCQGTNSFRSLTWKCDSKKNRFLEPSSISCSDFHGFAPFPKENTWSIAQRTMGRARGLHMVSSPVTAQLVQLQLLGDLSVQRFLSLVYAPGMSWE